MRERKSKFGDFWKTGQATGHLFATGAILFWIIFSTEKEKNKNCFLSIFLIADHDKKVANERLIDQQRKPIWQKSNQILKIFCSAEKFELQRKPLNRVRSKNGFKFESTQNLRLGIQVELLLLEVRYFKALFIAQRELSWLLVRNFSPGTRKYYYLNLSIRALANKVQLFHTLIHATT